ncbi:MAG: S1 RNA-binding domain-containing protein [Candidatus Daviesbacteria bacterium]|nr:S1 RNA-binding domain-containing protein [Candidatus Daviesbacteria bacterium]
MTDSKKVSMADLMAKAPAKFVSLYRGDSVEGKIVSISDSEYVLDLGSKSEGVLPKRELPDEMQSKLQVGDKVSGFVLSENEFGQALITYSRSSLELQKVTRGKSPEMIKKWQKFISAVGSATEFKGVINEANKGGLIVEAGDMRGFLPTSQLSTDLITTGGQKGGIEGLVGEQVMVRVLEVDPTTNRLIFSSRKDSPEIKSRLKKAESGQKVKAKVLALTPLGVFTIIGDHPDLSGLEGLVLNYETSWEKDEDIASKYKVGQEIEAVILGIDENLGRLSLSLRAMQEDPFEQISEKFILDDVVSGTVIEVTQNGVKVQLEGAEGFIPLEKLTSLQKYEVGQKTNFLVGVVDKRKRLVNLAPFLTTTTGLIYK